LASAGAAITSAIIPAAAAGKFFIDRIDLNPPIWFCSFNLNASFP
jgi:hypothetical protein